MEKMHLNSYMLIVQSIVKTGLILGLVFLGLGTVGAVTGYIVSAIVAGIAGLIMMYNMYRALPKPEDGQLSLLDNIKLELKYGLPISIGGIINWFSDPILYVYSCYFCC